MSNQVSPHGLITASPPLSPRACLPTVQAQESADRTTGGSAKKDKQHIDKDRPLLRDRVRLAGHEGFTEFEVWTLRLDDQLRELSHKSRQLGSSSGILSASIRLRKQIRRVLYLLRENAADLFPYKISRQDTELDAHRFIDGKRATDKEDGDSNLPDRECFATELQSFSEDISTLLHCFGQFQGVLEEIPDETYWTNLAIWAVSLGQFEGDYQGHATQRYLHDAMVDIIEMVHMIATKVVPVFIKHGIPTINEDQKRSTSTFNNQSTVAVLFSGTTATMLQSIWDTPNSHLEVAAKTFWFVALVLSTSAAVNSLLALTWIEAIFRSPDSRVPWWVRIWMRRSPLVLLVASVACFFLGLMVYVFSSDEPKVTTYLTTVSAALCSFGLVILSGWFALEQQTWLHYKGEKWFADVLTEIKQHVTCKLSHTIGLIQLQAGEVWHRGREELHIINASRAPDTESGIPLRAPGIRYESEEEPSSYTPFWPSPEWKAKLTIKEQAAHRWHEAFRQLGEMHWKLPSTVQREAGWDLTASSNSPPPYDPPAPQRPDQTGTAREPTTANIPRIQDPLPQINQSRQDKPPQGFSPTLQREGVKFQLAASQAFRVARTARLRPMLERLSIFQAPPAEQHAALVRFIKFSPDGKFMLTFSYDKCIVLEVAAAGDSIVLRTPHISDSSKVPNFGIRQLEWSPTGNKVLFYGNGSTMVLNVLTGKKIFLEKNEGGGVQKSCSVAWCGDRKLLSVTDNGIFETAFEEEHESMPASPGSGAPQATQDPTSTKTMLGEFRVDSEKIHIRSFVPLTINDSKWILCMATLNHAKSEKTTTTKTKSGKATAAKTHSLILYNIAKGKADVTKPVFNEMSDIALTDDNKYALVSFDNKSPPQLWRLDFVMTKGGAQAQGLTLRHTYMPKAGMDFAGLPSIFGTAKDELVLRAGSTNTIHVWDRDTAVHLHSIKLPDGLGQLTALTWNHGLRSDWMMATGTHDGKVQIWTIPQQRPGSGDPAPAYTDSLSSSPSLLERPHVVHAPTSSISQVMLASPPQTQSPAAVSDVSLGSSTATATAS